MPTNQNTAEQAPDNGETLCDGLALQATPPAISVNNVTVKYRAYQERPTSLKESIIRFAKTRRLSYYTSFNALSGVSFDVEAGQVFAIVGSNGAGKSTLLRVMAGVLPPATGKATVRGTIDSLIQLGAGFDMELTAVENIYLNGSLHGKSRKEIKERVPGILEFAELQDFANTPIKYYSSGMFARLGFSVAIDNDPDILIVDEVLGVGDERFQNKCKGIFQGLIARKKTIIIVSHDLTSVQELASKTAVLSKGRLVYLGDTATAIAKYRDAAYETALTA